MRQCRTCGLEQDTSEYYVTKKNDCKGGIYTSVHCKTCERKRSKEQFRYKNYRVTLEEYQAMLTDCGGKCQICDIVPENYALCIDHCHYTGKIRGLLCKKCNSALGYLHDKLSLIEKAAEYMKQYE